jgi:histidinol-phosphate phosphatase family protein
MPKPRMNLKDLNIDKSWTLFLDRDGVINKKLDNDYVKHWVEFEFLDQSLVAIRELAKIFGRIVVVTNQQGIGKRLYRTEDLELIHKNMLYEISYHGGRIDQVYFSPYLDEENHPTRKPGIGMAHAAIKEFPEIDLKKSIVAGDSMSDMEFGRNAGMYTVLIGGDKKTGSKIDFHFPALIDFSNALQS